jgi:hypothetical protein
MWGNLSIHDPNSSQKARYIFNKGAGQQYIRLRLASVCSRQQRQRGHFWVYERLVLWRFRLRE